MSENATLPDGRQVESLKVSELKKELEVLGLDRNGFKKDLARRLSNALLDSKHMKISSGTEPVAITNDEPIAVASGCTNNFPTKSDTKSDRPSTSDVDSDNSVENATNCDGFNVPMDSVHSKEHLESLEANAVEENVEPSIQVQVAVLQDDMARSPVAKEYIPGESLPAVDVAVELHEEEEDYGDEEENEELEETTSLKDAMENSQTAEGSTSETAPIGDVNKVSSASRKPTSSSRHTLVSAKKETRGVGFTVEAPERVNPPTDAKCPISSLVYIRCLVRPFTANQLATMLEAHFGRASELWLDRIKSTAVARFPNEVIAAKCREGLDGCRWPSINPRILQCDFALEGLFSWLKEHGEVGDKLPPKHFLGAASSNEINDGRGGQKRTENSTDKSESSSKVKRHRLHDSAKETVKASRGRGEEQPPKSLDDLFKKTLITPSVYWLPLAAEAAAAQLKARKQEFLLQSTRRPVPKRNVEERRRENRSPFTEELGNAPSSATASNPLLLPGTSAKERRQRERTPSPGNRRLPRERRRSPSPRRPRYANRTPSPRFGGTSFYSTTNTAAAPRRPLSPLPRYRRRTPPRR